MKWRNNQTIDYYPAALQILTNFNDFSKFFLIRETDDQEGRYILRLVPTRGGSSRDCSAGHVCPWLAQLRFAAPLAQLKLAPHAPSALLTSALRFASSLGGFKLNANDKMGLSRKAKSEIGPNLAKSEQNTPPHNQILNAKMTMRSTSEIMNSRNRRLLLEWRQSGEERKTRGAQIVARYPAPLPKCAISIKSLTLPQRQLNRKRDIY